MRNFEVEGNDLHVPLKYVYINLIFLTDKCIFHLLSKLAFSVYTYVQLLCWSERNQVS